MAFPDSSRKAPNVFIEVSDDTGAPIAKSASTAPGPIISESVSPPPPPPSVQLSDLVIADASTTATSSATYGLTNTGSVYSYTETSPTPSVYPGPWLVSGSAGDFESRMTLLNGTATALGTATFDSWHNMADTGAWEVQLTKEYPPGGIFISQVQIDIRNAITQVIQATAVVTLETELADGIDILPNILDTMSSSMTILSGQMQTIMPPVLVSAQPDQMTSNIAPVSGSITEIVPIQNLLPDMMSGNIGIISGQLETVIIIE